MRTLIFVDDEPRVLQGLQRQFYQMRTEWHMRFADSGAKTLEFMAAQPADVVVTDMMMPGMDGAQLLTEVMKRYPNTVRIVLSGHADRESALRLVGPAHQYLSKPTNTEELRHAINRAFSLLDLLRNEQLKRLVSSTCSLPTLPALHNQLTQELLREDPSMDRIAEIVSLDISMVSKMLQLVNSAFFGLPQPLITARDAIMYLGVATVRALVLTLQVFSQYEQKQIHGFSIEALTRHSWLVSVFSRRIAEAERCDARVADQCVLAGLLHDLGQLVLAAGVPEVYGRVLEHARFHQITVWEAEQAEFGTTHAEVGGYLLGLWGLPNPVVEAVAFHHHPAAAASAKFSPVIAVHVANSFAHDYAQDHPDWPGNQVNLASLTELGLAGRLDAWRTTCFSN